ncbi:hypothetical protein [Natronoflexus pectinivorans]|uniref:Uncharacterized protein n=1 Tax=Natronoflexus pectinivorans TaxID=682526 RepID=A0A4V2RVI4_9BACT|nr:hypothetical protein [Natronoflexus pectinivorans]TCO04434.1 hypothetical protein EV194_11823 [Natronoflexus pectinivorans]
MKKKLFFAIAAGIFVAATVFNMNLLQSNNNEEISWESISIMAEASVIRERVDVEPDMEGGSLGVKYCWTQVSLGGVLIVTPCGTYNANTRPQYKCGRPIFFSWNGGVRKQCN